MDPLRSSKAKSSPRFPNSGNGTKQTQAINIAPPAPNTTNPVGLPACLLITVAVVFILSCRVD